VLPLRLGTASSDLLHKFFTFNQQYRCPGIRAASRRLDIADYIGTFAVFLARMTSTPCPINLRGSARRLTEPLARSAATRISAPTLREG